MSQSDAKNTRMQCPTCSAAFWSELSSKSLPFCSERCQMIDLNRWMNHEIGLPYEGSDEDHARDQVEPRREWTFE
jgi:endogenous inhibitor of DNA gyrase (YacG/DUF329 family)